MLAAAQAGGSSKLGFELAATVGLNGLHEATKAAWHCDLRKGFPVCGQKAWTQQNIGIAAEDIYGREGKHLTKMHGINLDNLPRGLGCGDLSALLVLGPLGAQRVLFG